MKTYKKFRKPSKLILACMTRSKSVQIAWILMILINLTHFFIDLLEVFFLLFRKPFHYLSLFKKMKKQKKQKNVHILPCLLWAWFSRKCSWICVIFAKKCFFRTDRTPKSVFLFFWSKNINYPSIVFLTKSYNFHEKSCFFPKNEKKVHVLEK